MKKKGRKKKKHLRATCLARPTRCRAWIRRRGSIPSLIANRLVYDTNGHSTQESIHSEIIMSTWGTGSATSSTLPLMMVITIFKRKMARLDLEYVDDSNSSNTYCDQACCPWQFELPDSQCRTYQSDGGTIISTRLYSNKWQQKTYAEDLLCASLGSEKRQDASTATNIEDNFILMEEK